MCTSCGWADQFSDDPSAPGVNTLPEPEPANENGDTMTDPAPMNRRAQAKAATRAKCIAAARKLWAEPGTYESVGIREIAAEMGMTTGSIFANFTGKADLWRTAMGYEPPVDGPAVRALLQRTAQLREAA